MGRRDPLTAAAIVSQCRTSLLRGCMCLACSCSCAGSVHRAGSAAIAVAAVLAGTLHAGRRLGRLDVAHELQDPGNQLGPDGAIVRGISSRTAKGRLQSVTVARLEAGKTSRRRCRRRGGGVGWRA